MNNSCNCKNYKILLKEFFVCYEWTNIDLFVFVDIDSNQYMTFVLVNSPKKTAQIRAIVKVQWLHDKKLFQQFVTDPDLLPKAN